MGTPRSPFLFTLRVVEGVDPAPLAKDAGSTQCPSQSIINVSKHPSQSCFLGWGGKGIA